MEVAPAFGKLGQLGGPCKGRTIDPTPHTPVRRYHGNTSYLDRFYFSAVAARVFALKGFRVQSSHSTPGGSDHDPLFVQFGTWSEQAPKGPRCSTWTHATLRLFHADLQATWQPRCYPALDLQSAESAYQDLSRACLASMEKINSMPASHTPPPSSSSWENTVKALLRKARQRSKLLFAG